MRVLELRAELVARVPELAGATGKQQLGPVLLEQASFPRLAVPATVPVRQHTWRLVATAVTRTPALTAKARVVRAACVGCVALRVPA